MSINFSFLDELPNEWKKARVKNILDYNHHYPIGDGDHGSIKPEMYQDDGIPYLRVQNLTWGFNINYDNLVYISDEVNQANSKSILMPNDILIAKTGATVGKMAIIPESMKQANTTSSVGKITINQKIFNNLYFAYLFSSPMFQEQIKEKAYQKSAQPGFNIDDLIEFNIIIPPRDIQNKIANHLDKETTKIDLTIAKNEELIKLLSEKRVALINQVVTKGLNPDVPMKDSGDEWIGEIPKHWKIDCLKHNIILNALTLTDTTDSNYEFDYVDIGSVSLEKGIEKYEHMIFEDSPSRARRIVKKDDVIISTVRTYLKAIAIIPDKENIIVSTGFAVLTPTNINSRYLGYMVKSEYFTNLVSAYSVGVSYPAINSTDLINLDIVIPPDDEQKQIADYLDKEISNINNIINNVSHNINLLEEYKTSLIHHVVTGKIDVRGEEI